jgi:hypothetical protein
MHYRPNGGRSLKAVQSGQLDELKAIVGKRWYDKRMGCCDDKPEFVNLPLGAKQPGDVLARALWRGNKQWRGFATNRRYPRMSFPNTTWVAPQDVQMRPQDWQIVLTEAPPVPAKYGNGVKTLPTYRIPEYEGLEGVHEALVAEGQHFNTLEPAEQGTYRPDVGRIVRLANEALSE